MILLNKMALSSFDFKSINSLLFFQCVLSVALAQTCSAAGLVAVAPLNIKALFVGMIGTS
ncbi:GDP-mannose golgi apparatus [Micractinium conductrix]|uniref:GDP-mannose golgi apparatus n=1 Tax=Micractinium conductrix TaxID=554055 RepID=A0A2P6UZL8_9CHLO|nr:GDP-mannose golgi apparatus [Micractinium conductrix]|eukprot:PSC67285.1 GDP-mannose golgi apparatus [Micractinium conductrix]